MNSVNETAGETSTMSDVDAANASGPEVLNDSHTQQLEGQRAPNQPHRQQRRECARVCVKWGLFGAAVAMLLLLGAAALLGVNGNDGDGLDNDPSADYRRIDALLDAQQWPEANRLSMEVALKASGRAGEGWFDTEAIERFPCEVLGHLDRLWSHHSDGRFGFRAQAQIYQQVVDDFPEAEDQTRYHRFAEAVGWIKDGQLVPVEDLFANLGDAPAGHLPISVPPQAYRPTSPKSRSGSPERVHRMHRFMNRVEECLP